MSRGRRRQHGTTMPGVRLRGSMSRLRTNRHRQIFNVIGAIVALLTSTYILVELRNEVSVATSLSLFLLVVVAITASCGTVAGIGAAIAGPLLANWYFIPPYHTFRITSRDNVLELIVFVSTSAIVAIFVSLATRREKEAKQAIREASILSALNRIDTRDPLPETLKLLISTFGFTGASLITTRGSEEEVVLVSGTDAPSSISNAAIVYPLDDSICLAASGNSLSESDGRLLRSFADQFSSALQQSELKKIALEAESLAKADELRTAILRTVSHDLRSPLASIKASVSSLRQNDIAWPEQEQQEFFASIESETDRLTRIVSNLLDLSRIEAGVLRPSLRQSSLEDVVSMALDSCGDRTNIISTDLPIAANELWTDPTLLERVLANLLENATHWTAEGSNVLLRAHLIDQYVTIEIIDHGPGIAPRERKVVLQPFHRLTDSIAHGNLGLGLAIADRLVAAMHGTLDLRDTPGGGLTVAVSLPISEDAVK